ncbi:hypothetical protein FACS1894142_8700 [Spirochaetia bacterium]|nr:hypothetical protein FACS1894142_8700 [Spirochaetia bacterium]
MTEIIPYLSDSNLLTGLACILFLVLVVPAFLRWFRTVRCPKCHALRLEFQGFDVRDKVVGQSSATFGGGAGGGIFRGIFGFLFGHASRRNADPFIREWGTARFLCKKCGCNVEIDGRRDRK